MVNHFLNSHIVVISWWSNCLGLYCLHNLVEHTQGRKISVVQVGKSTEQMKRFRRYLPQGVNERHYSPDAPAEHSRVIKYLVFQKFPEADGMWFFDHDLFFEQNIEPWLEGADEWFNEAHICLCTPNLPPDSPSITSPAFWLSPKRWPQEIASFDPLPFQTSRSNQRPDLYRRDADLKMPYKDTLVQARDELETCGMWDVFPFLADRTQSTPLTKFPHHTHLAGLSMFAGPVLPPHFRSWMQATVENFTRFFESCPEDWLAIEDPLLLERLAEFQDALMPEEYDDFKFDQIRHGYLNVKLPRAKLLSALITELDVSDGRSLGNEAFKLHELGTWSDEQIAGVIPFVLPGCEISIRDGFVFGHPHDSRKSHQLFPMNSPALTAFNMFNGFNSLAEVSTYLQDDTGWESNRSFAYTRGLFLYLVVIGICRPKNVGHDGKFSN